jgi:putative membrane protein
MYLTLKALHIFFVLFWVSGMTVQALLLRAGRKLPGVALPQELARLRILQKWDRVLTTPAMVLALSSGLLIAMEGDWFGNGWLTPR